MGDVGSARYEMALFLPCPTAIVYEETLNLGNFMHIMNNFVCISFTSIYTAGKEKESRKKY